MDKWPTIIKSLIKILEKHGFTPTEVFDGEESYYDTFIDAICAVDESYLFVTDQTGRALRLNIALGNAPSETVADHTLSKNLNEACNEFTKKWESWD